MHSEIHQKAQLKIQKWKSVFPFSTKRDFLSATQTGRTIEADLHAQV